MPRRLMIKNVSVQPKNLKFQLVTDSTVSTRGDYEGWNLSASLLVFNRAKGEYLGPGGGYSFYDGGTLYDTATQEMEPSREATNGDWRKAEEPIPKDWADDAEISFFGSEPCGRISFPYEVKGVKRAYHPYILIPLTRSLLLKDLQYGAAELPR